MYNNGTILIVDDDDINLDVLEAMLTGLGYDVVRAQSGREALTCLDPSIDLLILDVMMPDLDGFAVVERIRSDLRFHDVPIIIATASTLLEDRIRAVESGRRRSRPRTSPAATSMPTRDIPMSCRRQRLRR